LPVSERISDNYSHQKSLAFLALENMEMGDLPAALDDLWRCLLAMEANWAGARQSWRTYDTAGQIFIACESFTAATAFEKEALGLAVNEVDDPSFTYVSYTNLGLAYGKMQRVAEAITYAQLGYDIGRSFLPERSGKQMMAYSNLQLGYLYRQSGNYVQALAHYDDSLALCRDLDFPAYAYDAHKGRLSCHLAQHEDRAADEELRTTLGLFEQQRSRIRDESNRTTFFDSQQSVYDLAIDFEVSRMNNERRAFEYSEISRARSLVDMTGAGVTPVAAAADRASPPGSSPLSLEQIQRALPEQAQLLQYAVLEDKLLIWLVTNGEIRLETKEIGAAALSEKIVRYWQVAANVSERAQAEADQLAGELYTTLIAPFETRLDRQKQLCIVPDKALVYLPFGALRSPASRAYLASDYLIVYAPSATLFLHCTAVARQRDLRRPEYALSVGNPAFDRDLFRALPDLPASANEAEAIRRIYESGCVLIGERATEDRVKAEMMKADVINLASHYIVNQASPPRSGLLLTKGLASAGGEPGADGVLRAGEVYAMKLRQARLVVLAACRTGVEGYYKGEGMIGMSRAFIIAGVPLIVASLWPVDSEATALLIEKLHTYRKRAGLSTAAALQQAQRDFINGADARRQQPYYWASFVLIGGFAKI
jgi:CHAT domain-containing protein